MMNDKDFCALVDTLEPLPRGKTLLDVRTRAIDIYEQTSGEATFGGIPENAEDGAKKVERFAVIVIALAGNRLKPVDRLDSAILAQINSKGRGVFDMGMWHDTTAVDEEGKSCGTSHCRAGWATKFAHNGKELERVFDNEMAGAIIYKMSTGKIPDFYADTDGALRSIKISARSGN